MPSPLQEGRAHVGADRSAQRGPKVLSLGGASRQEAGTTPVFLSKSSHLNLVNIVFDPRSAEASGVEFG